MLAKNIKASARMDQDFEIQPTELMLAIIKGMSQLFFYGRG